MKEQKGIDEIGKWVSIFLLFFWWVFSLWRLLLFFFCMLLLFWIRGSNKGDSRFGIRRKKRVLEIDVDAQLGFFFRRQRGAILAHHQRRSSGRLEYAPQRAGILFDGVDRHILQQQ